MRVGLLTGGGDCPGLNAVIRGVVRRGAQLGDHEFVGFRNGWAGAIAGSVTELTPQSTAGILPRGGTQPADKPAGEAATEPASGDAQDDTQGEG